ncbi:PAS domain-containing sensor histidine kinase [Sphingomonas koreensis]|jgi:signal transduction histidine kinase|uniref:histidine kinase n=1 Tax=Sphingomonas koreensis TaxID=93064 RepID=A0AAJ4S2R1_9SPHN|nr:HAMP domain-containing sensor histidine kinase [Sphingomonas koreensis]MDC7812665.1 HAMP domain-containing sensor histidine kinase [Sphingomonas koreensis]RSU19223.1 PAS domain-containing sensor histidine kinase [Sphingomonas koreensis]RSU28453.1 PAS domain-containing sensor histidine kinase [Sphingomonas koreensis]RSU31225.1 PAS domain-containing sensor histidine kinase [Sphingomonas koreensis]RSU38058.1 PAS domain-containing sensor histidine kinase [Sphingomonas koreensis]
MNAIEPNMPIAMGRIGPDGRLVHAEARLADLNARAGGKVGAPLAVPPIASIARLAQRLGIAISRGVVAADGEDDIDLWVRAEPDSEGVRLEVSGWRPRGAWQAPEGDSLREDDFLRAEADWIWETDAAMRITHLAAEAGVEPGLDLAAMLGQPLTLLFALEADEEGALPILAAAAEQTRFDGQIAELRGTGQRVRISASPRIDAMGRFAGFSGSAVLVDPADEAGANAVADPEFTSEFGQRLEKALRTPLARIIANADSISAKLDGPLRDDYAEYATDISNAGRHLLSLVEDLADLSAIERDDFTVEIEPIDLADIARRAAGLLAVRASEADVRIEKPRADETMPTTGEFRRVLQIMVNLIGNAVRYSPPGGSVWVQIQPEGSFGCVIVADQGKGIAIEDQTKIFEKFGRVDPGEPGGSGLGLYIARRLARAMGGDILVDSAPNEGARFVLTLPRRDA